MLHLLHRFPQVDPMKRATLKDIVGYDWFKKDLPCYLFPDPDDDESSIIDAEAVKEVEAKFGVTEAEVHSALLGGDPQDQLRIAYHLIVDNKRIADETVKLEIRVSRRTDERVTRGLYRSVRRNLPTVAFSRTGWSDKSVFTTLIRLWSA